MPGNDYEEKSKQAKSFLIALEEGHSVHSLRGRWWTQFGGNDLGELRLSCDFQKSKREKWLPPFHKESRAMILDRKAIWEMLSHEETCPKHDLRLLAETLSYCGELYRAMDGEWVAFRI